jgi:hypothetical protein
MLPTFDDFIKAYPKYKGFSTSPTARDIYGFIINVNNINRMMISNDNGKNALFGILNDLESLYNGKRDFDFSEGFVKQCVGSMIKFILFQFGYEKYVPKEMPRGSYIYFTSAMSYKKTHSGNFQLIQELSIVPISKVI